MLVPYEEAHVAFRCADGFGGGPEGGGGRPFGGPGSCTVVAGALGYRGGGGGMLDMMLLIFDVPPMEGGGDMGGGGTWYGLEGSVPCLWPYMLVFMGSVELGVDWAD